jgi:hypothetical protein
MIPQLICVTQQSSDVHSPSSFEAGVRPGGRPVAGCRERRCRSMELLSTARDNQAIETATSRRTHYERGLCHGGTIGGGLQSNGESSPDKPLQSLTFLFDVAINACGWKVLRCSVWFLIHMPV